MSASASTREQRRRWADRRRIDILDPEERTFWAKFLGVEEHELLAAVDKVGSNVEKVREYIHFRQTIGWIVGAGREERRGIRGSESDIR